MKSIKYLVIGSLLLFISNFSNAQVISATEFMKMYKSDKNLKVIDAGKSNVYNAFHIKNAVNIPHATLYKTGPVPALILGSAELAKIMGNHGISETNTLVVYDENSQKYSSRVYWILKYLGVKNVWILHKDLTDWRKARIPVTSSSTGIKKTTFSPHVNASVYTILEKEQVKNDVIVDCRTNDEYLGTTENSKGHIPGAINLNYLSILKKDGSFKPKDEIVKILSEHGLSKDQNIVLYCQTSIRASVVFAALKGILGWPNVKLYDGAYVAWTHSGMPLSKKPLAKPMISQR
ncbi:MAG: sulfurtransferase [Bacteroidales bacterium]|nr:sulfurtransferase [Bacteroidales bacterium]